MIYYCYDYYDDYYVILCYTMITIIVMCCHYCTIIMNMLLVGGWPTPLKNDGVSNSWDDDIPNWMEKSSKCSKPPSSI